MPNRRALANPEGRWAAPAVAVQTMRREVESRLGPTSAPVELLSGGLANLSVRIGADRVLRIFTRDPAQAQKERQLVEREWLRLRTPRVLSAGDDFLVLEYVPHQPLEGRASQGQALGRALAEIHARVYDRPGFLDGRLEVSEPFDDFLRALQQHVADTFASLDPTWHPLMDPVLGILRSLATRPAWPAVLLHGDFKLSNLHWTTTPPMPLVLDWEFAYAGPALMDIGQLLRWRPDPSFVDGFARGYREGGHPLEDDWPRVATILDLGNLVGLAASGGTDPRRQADVRRRIEETLGDVYA